jgi:hypothetical protein
MALPQLVERHQIPEIIDAWAHEGIPTTKPTLDLT